MQEQRGDEVVFAHPLHARRIIKINLVYPSIRFRGGFNLTHNYGTLAECGFQADDEVTLHSSFNEGLSQTGSQLHPH